MWSAGRESLLFGSFSYFIDDHEVWSSERNYVIRLYLKIPEKFMRLIFLDGGWAFTICSYGQIKTSYAIPSRINFPTQLCLV